MIPRDTGLFVPLMCLLTAFGIMLFVTKCSKSNERKYPCKYKPLKEFDL